MAIKYKKNQPAKSVLRVTCDRCGELQVKIYPWSSYNLPPEAVKSVCKKCKNKAEALARHRPATIKAIKKRKSRTLKSGIAQ